MISGVPIKFYFTSLACCALTGSLNCRRAWNWLFFVNVIIFITVPNLEKICKKRKVKLHFKNWGYYIKRQFINPVLCGLPVAVHPALQGRTCCQWWYAAQDLRLQPEPPGRQSLVTHQTELLIRPEAPPGCATAKNKLLVTIFKNVQDVDQFDQLYKYNAL